MRRRQHTPEPPKPTVRRCERCGATASVAALRCTICGQPFASADQVSQLWGAVDPTPVPDEPPLLDLYASAGDSHVFRAGGHQGSLDAAPPDDDSTRRPAVGPMADPWASGSGTLASLPGRPESGSFVPPAGAHAQTAERSRGRGLRRALLALLLILVVAAAAGWFAGRPYLSGRIADNVSGAIDTELESIGRLPADADGRITVVEGDITRSLRANADAYAPITDPRVALSRNGVRVAFTLYGSEHVLTGTLAVKDGRVVLVDPVLTGPASRLIDLDEVTTTAEASIAAMFTRLEVRPVSAKTSDDTLVIATERA